jgi:hypothetical protein
VDEHTTLDYPIIKLRKIKIIIYEGKTN